MENVKENPKRIRNATKTSHVRNGPNGVNLKLVRLPVEMARKYENGPVKTLIIFQTAALIVLKQRRKPTSTKKTVI